MPTNEERDRATATMRAESLLGGGPGADRPAARAGKLTARERLDLLLEPDRSSSSTRSSTHRATDGEHDERVLGDGVVTGHGTIDGRDVFVFSQDFTVFGGSLSEAYAEKICKVMDLAMKVGAPIIGLNDSGGARIQEGVVSLGGYADIFLRNTLASGVVPQISVVLGPCAGGAVYSPAITDFIVMVEGTSYMFVTGPERGADRDPRGCRLERLGGATTHTTISGVAHLAADDEAEALARSAAAGHLPQNNLDDPPRADVRPADRGRRARHDRARRPDEAVRHARRHPRIVDDGEFLEIQPGWAQNIIVGFARLGGRSVGIVAQQPRCWPGARHRRVDEGGAIRPDLRLLQRPARDLRGRAGLPAGGRPGARRDHPHGAKLLFAYCEATVPKLTVITRKAYGGAYDVMSSKHIRGDVNLAWPTGRDRGDGRRGRGGHPLRTEIEQPTIPTRSAQPRSWRTTSQVREPLRGGGARLRRRRDRSVRHAPR